MLRLRAGSGLGDSIYLRPIADYFISHGDAVTVMSNHPDVFIGSGAKVEPFSRNNIDKLAHYAAARFNTKTTQFQDMCERVGVKVALNFDWKIRNAELVECIKKNANGRKIIMVHGGREPFGRSDGYGMEILPERSVFKIALNALNDCYRVGVGKGKVIYSLPADLDLHDKTSVSDLLDIGMISDGVISQCAFPIPIAESFDKPLMVVWSNKGLRSEDKVIASVAPQKILSKQSSKFIVDNWARDAIVSACKEWLV